MATEYLFSNNATTTLAQSVSATATVLNVASGTGNLFPSPTSGQAFAVTLVDAATGLTNEICYCTARSGDQLTVVRGREGTNAIAWSAGDTCANYITADVMENWLQESDLNGYATQAWSDGRYIQKASGPNDYTPIQGGVNKSTGNMWFSYTDASGNVKYAFSQPAGDYATNPALQSVNTNLQNQINNRVMKSGDTMTGTLNFTLNYSQPTAIVATGMSGPATAGQNPWTPQFISKSSNDGSLSALFCARDKVGSYPYMSFQFTEQNGTWHELQFRSDNRLYTDSGNVFALESDISNLQTQINGKQPAGDYVTGLAPGKIMQDFIVGVSGSGVHDIAFPRAFSSPPTTIVISHGLTNGSNSPVSVLGGWTSTGFQIQTNGSTSVNFLAVGPS